MAEDGAEREEDVPTSTVGVLASGDPEETGCAGTIARLRHEPGTATAVIALAFFTDFCLMLMLVPILPLMKDDLGIGEEQIGLLFSLKPLVQMISSPFLGTVADRFGTRYPMVLALVTLSASTALFAMANTYSLLCVARALQGLASSANIVAGMSHLSQLHSGGEDSTVGEDGEKKSPERDTAIRKALVGISAGVMAGAPLGGALSQLGGRRAPFIVLAVLLAIDAVARLVLLADPDDVKAYRAAKRASKSGEEGAALFTGDAETADMSSLVVDEEDVDLRAVDADIDPDVSVVDDPLEIGNGTGGEESKDDAIPTGWRAHALPYVQLAQDAQVMTILGTIFFGNGCIAFIEAMFPIFLDEVLGQDRLSIGFIYGAQTGLYMLVVSAITSKGDSLSRQVLMLMGVVIMGSAIPLMPSVHKLGWVVPLWLCSGVGMACIDSSCAPALAGVVENRHKSRFGAAFAMQTTANSMGFIAGPIIGGALTGGISFQAACIFMGLALFSFSPAVPKYFGFKVCPRRTSASHRELHDDDGVELTIEGGIVEPPDAEAADIKADESDDEEDVALARPSSS